MNAHRASCGRKNPLPFLYSLSSEQPLCSLRKGVIHKRVETLVSTLLCPCRAGKIRSLRKRLLCKHRCAHQTCVIAERRTDDLGISVLTAEGLRESEHAQRLEQLFAIARQSAAEHDTLRLEQIHKTCQTVPARARHLCLLHRRSAWRSADPCVRQARSFVRPRAHARQTARAKPPSSTPPDSRAVRSCTARRLFGSPCARSHRQCRCSRCTAGR